MGRVLALPIHVGIAEKVRDRLELDRMAFSENIYYGPCPLCGGNKSFFMWLHKACFHCYQCGADGVFGRAPESTIGMIAAANEKPKEG